MSSAHYFYRNFDIQKVINLICYMTEYPHTLTSTQKITRMYRCMLRREREWTINENRCDPFDYHKNIMIAREKLDAIMELSQNSALFSETLEHFEERVKKYLDPTMIINDSRQYSAVQGRSYVWDNKQLSNDPFGYFTGKPIAGRLPTYGFLYYPDFPYDSTVWNMDPPMQYNDEVETESFTSSDQASGTTKK